MALKLFLGCSGSGKTHRLYEHIINESLTHPELTYLIIVPEQYNLSTQRQLISMHPRKGILNIDVLSFTRLAHRVFEEVGYRGAKGATIDDIGKNLILRHMAVRNRDKLTVLSGVFNKLGYITEVKSVISEFMQYGIGDKELADIINNSSGRGILKAKLTDIRLLYSEFLSYINEKYITTEEILTKVSNEVEGSARLKKSVIVFDGYTGFTPVQLNLIRELMINCVDVYMTLLCDPNEKAAGNSMETDLFYLSHKTMASLDKICRENSISCTKEVIASGEIPSRFRYDDKGNELAQDKMCTGLIHLEKNLFRNSAKSCEPGMTPGDIHIFTGTDPLEEAIEAAVRIERLVREEGYHYRDIAVVSGDINTYMNACGRAFSRYGIPFFIDRTRPVMLNPLIEYIRALFDIITGDYDYEAVFRYLKSGVSGYDTDSIDALENYVLKFGIRGRKQWNEPFILRGKDEDDELLFRLNEIRERVAEETGEFADELGTQPEADVKVISTALYHFMSRHKLQDAMERMSGEFEEKGDPVRAKEYAKIYEEVCVLLDKMVRLLPGEVISLKEYRELLDAGFEEIRTGVIPGTDDHVQVGDITRTRLRNIKALFFMGVNDGIIPAAAGGGGMITDMEREFITDSNEGIELAPTARMQGFIQRLYLYMLTTKPSRHLYISYAGLSEEGDSLKPSYFVDTVKRMFPGIVTEYPDAGLKNRVYDAVTGYSWLAGEVQDIMGTACDEKKRDYLTLLNVLAFDGEYSGRVRYVVNAALEGNDRVKSDAISRAVAAAMYGSELKCSVTRLENYARCAYSHFLKYGLKLRERELFSFEAKDLGSIFHDTLQSYAQVLKEKKISWTQADEKTRDESIEEAIQRCIARNDYTALYGSFRTMYTINRMRRILKRSVGILTDHLNRGSFVPYDHEFPFMADDDDSSLSIGLADGRYIRLYGRIDRMDICALEDDDKVYVKVIDYKSGDKYFDTASVYAGLELQLAVYLNAGCEIISERFPGKKIIPAGMFYYHIDDPVVNDDTPEGMSGQEVEEEIAKKLKLRGLVNSDEAVYRLMDSDFSTTSDVIPVRLKKDGDFAQGSKVASTEEFGIISDYVNHKIGEMGEEIYDGNVEARPVLKDLKDKGPCRYCDYSGICGYRGQGSVFDPDTPEDDQGDDTEREEESCTNEFIESMRCALLRGNG